MTDFDKGGRVNQRARVYLGPSLGWFEFEVKPEVLVTSASYTIQPGDSIILVNFTGLVTIQLPDVAKWLQLVPPFNFPAGVLERCIFIKDLGGNAAANNITIRPFGTQKIDNLQQNFTIVQNRQLLRMYPLLDATGWYSG